MPSAFDLGSLEFSLAVFPDTVFHSQRGRSPATGLRRWGVSYATAGAPATTALPPAFSIFSMADLENLCAWMVIAEVSSPEPSTLMSAFLLETRPSFL